MAGLTPEQKRRAMATRITPPRDGWGLLLALLAPWVLILALAELIAYLVRT